MSTNRKGKGECGYFVRQVLRQTLNAALNTDDK